MSDLKCERWSLRESNSALQVLQVHLEAMFWERFSSASGSGSSMDSRARWLQVSELEGVKE